MRIIMFFKTILPESRKADFYLGYLDGCVFLDFDCSNEEVISLSRISFDGYGCCIIPDKKHSLDVESSKQFLYEMKKDVLDQEKIRSLVLNLIKANKDYIWADALDDYTLNVF